MFIYKFKTLYEYLSENNKTDEDRLTELLEKRASKFLNRALPDLPTEDTPVGDDDDASCMEEIDGLYELVSQTAATAADKEELTETVKSEEARHKTYEDIDIYSDPTDVVSAMVDSGGGGKESLSSGSSQRSTTGPSSRSSSLPRGGGGIDFPASNYYLEPVVVSSDDEEGKRVNGWRPRPAPRTSGGPTSQHPTADVSESQQPYVNTKMIINGRLPLSVDDGFDIIASVNSDTLRHVANRLYAPYLHGISSTAWHSDDDIKWEDFVFMQDEPLVVQRNVSFYQASHVNIAPNGCILMVGLTTD